MIAKRQNEVLDALRLATAHLPEVEERQGQDEMAVTIAASIATRRHLIVQAGTGTGKTLGYLVPALLSGKRTVVATYTKALQDQLAMHDLPLLAQAFKRIRDAPLNWAVLKGRNNYICLQRLAEMESSKQDSLDFEGLPVKLKSEIKRLREWSATSDSGDSGELPWSPSESAWRSVSVGSDECPGAHRCPVGDRCFAERARQKAAQADVIVVNTYIYGLHLAGGGALLPDHDVVVFDEAHQLEDVISSTVGVEIGPMSINTVSTAVRAIVSDNAMNEKFTQSSLQFKGALTPHLEKQLANGLPPEIREGLIMTRLLVGTALEALRSIGSDDESAKQRKLRGQGLCTRLAESIDFALGSLNGSVPFVTGTAERPRLEIAPLEVGSILNSGVWSQRTAILTSATIPLSLPQRIGLPENGWDAIDVGSPFNYEKHSLMYCARNLPAPNEPTRDEAVHDEITWLIEAAGGRTLALFTTYRAMHAAADAITLRLPFKIWRQDDLPKMALLAEFAKDESACLFATAGFFQGVDVPGRTLSLVIIDKIPFPRPDDPLLKARRDLIGPAAFNEIDIPRAASQLAQAAGRLIRTQSDKGVVAILDPRLATKGYGKKIVAALPPMPRTINRTEVEDFLRFATS